MRLVTCDGERLLVELQPDDCLLVAYLCDYAIACDGVEHIAQQVELLKTACEALALAGAARAHGAEELSLAHVRDHWAGAALRRQARWQEGCELRLGAHAVQAATQEADEIRSPPPSPPPDDRPGIPV